MGEYWESMNWSFVQTHNYRHIQSAFPLILAFLLLYIAFVKKQVCYITARDLDSQKFGCAHEFI